MQDEIKKLHNGLIKCPWNEVPQWMPEILPILNRAPVDGIDWVVDAKVHMLMPAMFPCIPNWHGDAIPRDKDGNLLKDQCNDNLFLYLWLSNPPLTEFEDGRKITPNTWIKFRQKDIHRGTKCTDFTWRLFIRLMPTELVVRPRTGKDCLRRHTQVYLDADDFKW